MGTALSACVELRQQTAAAAPVLEFSCSRLSLMQQIVKTTTLRSLAQHRSDAFNVWLSQLEEDMQLWVKWLAMWEKLGSYRGENLPPPVSAPAAVFAGDPNDSAAARLAASSFGADPDPSSCGPSCPNLLAGLRRLQGLFVQRLMNALRREILERHSVAVKAENEQKLATRTELKAKRAAKKVIKVVAATGCPNSRAVRTSCPGLFCVTHCRAAQKATVGYKCPCHNPLKPRK